MNKYLKYFLTTLRIIVGWHFLYEGMIKIFNPEWSAKFYLMGSTWIFSGIFHFMADSPLIMKMVDFLNVWGLTFIGLSLITGFLVRWASAAGALLLLFYFVAYPPIPGYTLGVVSEGSYLWVDKTLIEFFILLVFVIVPSNLFFGADRLIKRWKDEKAHPAVPPEKRKGFIPERREFLRDMIGIPFLGAFAYALYRKKKFDSYEEKFLSGMDQKIDGVSGSTMKSFNFSSLTDLKGQVPKGRLGNFEMSRMVMGGNLIGGWAHARDLIYASDLVKAYHTDERVMMTLQLAEKCGINTIMINPAQIRIVKKYQNETGGKLQFITDCGAETILEGVRISEEAGASAMYIIGGFTDFAVREDKYDEIIEAIELIRSYGKPAGIGAHMFETVQKIVAKGIKPDFWVKTLHHLDYWSAQVDPTKFNKNGNLNLVYPGFNDNVFCDRLQETIDFMSEREEPWIAFKVLAAGAIHPKEGFQHAFNNGADFICVGMYDFQLVDNSNILLDTLSNVNRIRSWRS